MLLLGRDLSQSCLVGSHLIFLSGDLGAGKTTLVRGFLSGLGYHATVKSPTYTLVESYFTDQRVIHHFDLYRLEDSEELEEMGIRDYFTDNTICLFEWPEKAQNILPKPTMFCTIQIVDNGRNVNILSQV